MDIIREALAGTVESSDIAVRVGPGKDGIEVTVTSNVAAQFGSAIEQCIRQTLSQMGVSSARVHADDKGALDCVIRARVQAAACRAADSPAQPWTDSPWRQA